MNIRMAGIDYTNAGVGERERFTFTSAARATALCRIRRRYAGTGCVIIATCNRTELWLSAEGGECPDPERILCELKNVSYDAYKHIFVSRSGQDAATHLFYVAGGMKSQIMGENQILSQVKEALEAAREAGSATPVLQKLFQSAVASAKRVRTETGIARADVSIASAALDFIRGHGFEPCGASCLVIGSGVIGRLCAELFSGAGADVTMTLRSRKRGGTTPPRNVRVIDYDERYSFLAGYQIVISATVSPHHTITHDEAAGRLPPLDGGRERVFLDLAMPRDIDPDVKKIAGVRLFDIDQIHEQIHQNSLSQDCPSRDCPAAMVKEIIDGEISAFVQWNAFRVNIETILAARNEAAEDVARRLRALIKDCARDEMAEERLKSAITLAAGKVMDKMLFGIRDNLDPVLWAPCFEALRRSAVVEAGKERA
ncbi:MAG: glutamyl-tRNA reductase [Spirochaetaceae bacterium]|jgi:glutamyl-tRNA reductase|nr:glutamyl-tRNA reductase [Spirochaetaceae bacterium]